MVKENMIELVIDIKKIMTSLLYISFYGDLSHWDLELVSLWCIIGLKDSDIFLFIHRPYNRNLLLIDASFSSYQYNLYVSSKRLIIGAFVL